jgi:hypothetical protein
MMGSDVIIIAFRDRVGELTAAFESASNRLQ